jgi:dTMP kinase
MEELFLFMADHAGHLAKTIIPSLQCGAIILSDRYTDSTAAYQGVTLRNVLPDPVQWIRSLYKPWNIPPDRTLLFVLDPGLALQRMQSRPGREKFERFEFLQSVDKNFRMLAAGEPERFVLIDAGKPPETVAEEALLSILELLSRGPVRK